MTIEHAFRSEPPLAQNSMVRVRGGALEFHPTPLKDERDPVRLASPWQIEDFELDRYEVSNADWRRFLAEQSESYRRDATPVYWDRIEAGSPEDQLPVTFISWTQARDFAEWAGKRLPSMPEWTWAARNGKRWDRVPWGDAAVDAGLSRR